MPPSGSGEAPRPGVPDDRARAMAASVELAAAAGGLDPTSVDLLSRAHRLAMEPRLAALPDDHHPAYLHPGRTVLVLLRDVGALDGTTLALGALLETMDDGLRVSADVVRTRLDPDLAGVLLTVPSSTDDDRVERLIALPEEIGLAVMAERLDQMRHLHLREELQPSWAGCVDEVRRIWLPLAERSGTKLATRFAHWERTFSKRM